MKNQTMLSRIRGGLIVSCQALEDEPLYGGDVMAYMALAAQQGGAVGIRANGASDIQSIRKKVNLPIIGIEKQVYPDSPVYITPTMEQVKTLIASDADIIALDATDRKRPGNASLRELFDAIHAAGKLVMADISCLQEGIDAARLGADMVSTTLAGYTQMSTEQALDMSTPKEVQPDYTLIRSLANELDIPVIAEGHVHSPEEAATCIQLGAFAVVVGAAITRPQLITARFVSGMQSIGA